MPKQIGFTLEAGPTFLITLSDMNSDGVVAGVIATKNLIPTESGDKPFEEEYSGAMQAVGAIVLAHACAGVDVESPAYQQGIEAAMKVFKDHYS